MYWLNLNGAPFFMLTGVLDHHSVQSE